LFDLELLILSGQGHYYLKGAVEDSATAEISRSQVIN
jgi:malate synthase